MELPCKRIKTNAGLFLAFLLTWHCKTIYDDDISIVSHSRPADLVSTVLQAASCNLLELMVLGYLCIKAYHVEKPLNPWLANVCTLDNSCEKQSSKTSWTLKSPFTTAWLQTRAGGSIWLNIGRTNRVSVNCSLLFFYFVYFHGVFPHNPWSLHYLFAWVMISNKIHSVYRL